MKRSVIKSNLLVLLMVFTLLGSLVGCGEKSEEAVDSSSSAVEKKSEEVKEEDPVFRIGVTHYGLQNEFTMLISSAQEEMAKELGVEISIFDGNYDVNTQIGQFENMIEQGYDAIIFSPVDVDALAVAVEKAHEAGVPVFGVNTKVNSDLLTSYIGSNDVTAGEIEMTYIAEKLNGKGNIVILEGPLGSSAQIQRKEGIHNILEKYPEINVLSEKTANWSRAEGLALMENWLQAFPDKIDAVVGQNDEMALGAVVALEGIGLKEETPVIGVDAIADALAAVQEGRVDATVFQDAVGQGKMSVQVAVDYLSGADIEDEYWILFELVTPDNVEEFIQK